MLANSQFARIFFGPVHDWIYSFHMPLFFFMSGYSYLRYSSARASRLSTLLRSKGAKLLLPYGVLTTLWFPLKAIVSAHARRPVSLTWAGYITQLIIPWKNVIIFYWFMPTLFVTFVLTNVLLRLSKRERVLLPIVALGAAITYFVFKNENYTGWEAVFNLGGVLHNYVFFCMGSVVACHQLEPWITKYGSALTPASIAIFVSCSADVRKLDVVVFSMALMNIWGLWAVVHRYQSSSLAMIGDHAFAIYLWSCAPQLALSAVCDGIFHAPVSITIAVVFLGGLIAPLFLARRLRPPSNRIFRDAMGLSADPRRSLA